jgi:hypothetical protein
MELSILPAAANCAINHGTETYWGTCNLHMKLCGGSAIGRVSHILLNLHHLHLLSTAPEICTHTE